jgi:hypothetical protein
MDAAAGNKYVLSGNFNAARLAWVLTLGCVAAFALGLLYGVITHINPIIYLNALVLIFTAVILLLVVLRVIQYAHCRNNSINIIITLLICYVAWHAQWAYSIAKSGYGSGLLLLNPLAMVPLVSQFASEQRITVGPTFGTGVVTYSGGWIVTFYAIEFLAFMVFPPYLMRTQKTYYCESCNQAYKNFDFFSADAKRFNEQFSKTTSGHYGFLKDIKLVSDYRKLEAGADLAPVINVRYSVCTNCFKNNIIDLNTMALKRNKTLANNKKLVRSIYVDSETQLVMSPQVKERIAQQKRSA